MLAHLRALTALTLSTFVSRVGLHLLIIGDSLAVGLGTPSINWHGWVRLPPLAAFSMCWRLVC